MTVRSPVHPVAGDGGASESGAADGGSGCACTGPERTPPRPEG